MLATLRLPAGASVTVHDRLGGAVPRDEAPQTPALKSGTVNSAGSIVFAGLAASSDFWAVYQDTDGHWRWVAFSTPASEAARYSTDDPEDTAVRVDMPAGATGRALSVWRGGVEVFAVNGDGSSLITGAAQGLVINAKDYGAVGDGVTDDRAAVRAAITAASAAGGGIVFFPPGTYLCPLDMVGVSPSYSLRIPTNVTLQGQRSASVLRFDPNPFPGYRNFIDFAPGAHHAAIRDLVIDGGQTTRSGNEDCFGVSFGDGSHDLEISGCEFRHIKGDCINSGEDLYANVDRVRIVNNDFHDVTGQAVLIGGHVGYLCRDWIVAGNHMADTLNGVGDTAGAAEVISIYPGTQNLVVAHNTMRNWGPIYLETLGGVTLLGNTQEAPYGLEGIVMGGGGNYLIRGNIVDNSVSLDDVCISCQGGPSDFIIEGNRLIVGAGDDYNHPGAIAVPDTGQVANGIVIRGNVITGGSDVPSTQSAISLGSHSGSTGAIIDGNLVLTSQAIVSTHQRTSITNNRTNGIIAVVNAADCSIKDNYAAGLGTIPGLGGTSIGVFLFTTPDCSVTGNDLSTPNVGIEATAAPGLLVQGNRVKANAQAISLRGSTTVDAFVTANRLELTSASGTYGVHEENDGGVPVGTKVFGNRVIGAATPVALSGAGSAWDSYS